MPRRHSDQTRADALADVPTLGISGVAKKHGLGKATISRWAEEAGIGTFQAQTREATEARQRSIEERRAVVVDRMWEIADVASKREIEIIRASKAPDLRSVVGARTRAIHDAELLSGRATARTEHVEPIDVELERLAAEVKARADARS